MTFAIVISIVNGVKMNNLTTQVYRIRCLTRDKDPYLNSLDPIEHILQFSKDNSHGIIRAIIFEYGAYPFVHFSNTGIIFPSIGMATSSLKKIISRSMAINEWSINKGIKIEELEELSSRILSNSSSTFDILMHEYKIEELTLPSNEAIKSAAIMEMGGDKYWYICSYYQGIGYKYLANSESFTSIAFGDEQPLWLDISSSDKAWKSKSEEEAISMSKTITRKSTTTPYCFPRYLKAPD